MTMFDKDGKRIPPKEPKQRKDKKAVKKDGQEVKDKR